MSEYNNGAAKRMVVVFGYDRSKSNSDAVSRDRALKGFNVFRRNMLDPGYDILLNAGKPDEMGYMSQLEKAEATNYGMVIDRALRRGESNNTWENAEKTAEIAKNENVSKIYLCTSRNHIKRSGDFLEKTLRDIVYNIEVVKCPTEMNAYDGLTLKEIRENSDFRYNALAQELIPVGDVREIMHESKNLSI